MNFCAVIIVITLSVFLFGATSLRVEACDGFEKDYVTKRIFIIQISGNEAKSDKEFVRMAKRCGFNILPYELGDKSRMKKSDDFIYKKDMPENSFDSIIIKASNRYSLDPALVKAVIHVESSFNHTAVSNKNAYGLMQILYPSTANDLGIYKKSELFNPEVNIEAGTRYLSERIDRFNSLTRALIAYNAGDSVAERVNHLRDMDKIPAETKLYLKKVMRLYKKYMASDRQP